jgi:methylenetetrahydrofolate dehydrogenase (NADP+)/methenyltetrahydrofolate cyclohydrolase
VEAKIIDGKSISKSIKDDLKEKIENIKEQKNIVPGLATILVGDDEASKAYVYSKEKVCKALGVYTENFFLERETQEEEVLKLIERLNIDEKINGILVQLPLPNHIDELLIAEAIDPKKDVDCINPINAGKLFCGKKGLIPCTPKGIIRLIKYTNVNISGKHAVVIGRSNIVGKPVASLLLKENATVTICHSKTKNLGEYTRRADIIVSAVGRAGLITGGMIKSGAIVIDAGTTMVDGKLKGDVNFDEAREVASYITPVPGGVGSMTTAMLVENILESMVI